MQCWPTLAVSVHDHHQVEVVLRGHHYNPCPVFQGTYFNCIMMMVASSVVLTVVVLNYHHRTAETHVMPTWVGLLARYFLLWSHTNNFSQVKSVFLQWLPWFLRMSRPGKKITRKTINMNSKMNELQLKEKACKSLLANVLDMDDDLRWVFGSTIIISFTRKLFCPILFF